LAISYEQLRQIGLSHAKATYVHAVASFFITHQLTDKQLHHLSNDELKDLLTQVKGVGPWTVELLLMFSMARTDVFPVDDLGIRQAMVQLYGIRSKDLRRQKARMKAIAAKWHPYQTYACLHLWHWKDNSALQ
jgi:DNA-3-methyladenine glycosylase II